MAYFMSPDTDPDDIAGDEEECDECGMPLDECECGADPSDFEED